MALLGLTLTPTLNQAMDGAAWVRGAPESEQLPCQRQPEVLVAEKRRTHDRELELPRQGTSTDKA